MTNHSRFFQVIGLVLLSALLLSGCTTIVKNEQPQIAEYFTLDSRTSLGQTTMPRYDGLKAITVYLQPETPAAGTIQLSLRTDPEDTENLRTATLAAELVTKPGYYTFEFSPLARTTSKDFFWLLKFEGSGSIQVGAAPGNTYLYGALYKDKFAQNAQMAFSLVYHTPTAILGLAGEAARWLWLGMIAVFLFILPGWALLSALWPGWSALHWVERAGLAAGASLPVYPLLFSWTNLVGLNLGAVYAWLPAGASGLYLLVKNIYPVLRASKKQARQAEARKPLFRLVMPPAADLGFILVLGLLIISRFWAVRSLDIPMWGDSYQHTVIAQLLVDHGGLFSSWQPYAETTSFTYHFGFHSLAAVFHWISGYSLPQSVLWTGQIVNILAVLALAPLAVRLGGNRWSAAAAVLLAGLLFQMPNFYTNWGRYTQLSGQVILVAFAWFFFAYIADLPSRSWKAVAVLSILLGGLAITHYRVILMALLLIPASALGIASRKNLLDFAKKTVLLGAGSLFLFLPWFTRVFSGYLLRWLNIMLGSKVTTAADSAGPISELGDVTLYIPGWFWFLLFLCIAWGLWRREKKVVVISIWWFLILLAANPHWINLPGRDILNSFAVLIAAYIPAAVIIGAAVGWLVNLLGNPGSSKKALKEKMPSTPARSLPHLSSFAMLLLVLGMGLRGARARLYDINPIQNSLATRADLRAAEWIRQHTSLDDTFVVNSFFAYSDSLIVGADGGWWLPVIAHRGTSLPPLTYGVEKGPVPNYVSYINELAKEVLQKGINHPDVIQLMVERGFDYIYIGQQQGKVNFGGEFLDLELLNSDPHFQQVYHQDRVWIFKIIASPGIAP